MTTEALQSTAQDVEQIRRLTHDYAWAIDNFLLDDLVALFTEDAIFDMRGFGAPAESAGREAVRAAFSAMIDSLGGCVHLTMNHLVDVDGDTATGRVYCHAFVLNPDGSRAENLALYEDAYARTVDGWKFSSRVIKPLLAGAPASDT
ncbi:MULTISPECIES: nuclear transport factor 2 family protein [Citricoccus]|uniref:nuclear transport factor 2 family protein n=1 Tax=Citricoccus TaxID=169133 RepID=UPI000255DFF3|nr:nuclear transport factor 2 family protein [Citricoccus sp. CH26A]